MLHNHDVLLVVHKNLPRLLTLYSLLQSNILQRLTAIKILGKLKPAVISLGVGDSLSDGGDVEGFLVADLVGVDDDIVVVVIEVVCIVDGWVRGGNWEWQLFETGIYVLANNLFTEI